MTSPLAFRVAVRYAAKMDLAKVQAVMIKIRKGAISGMNASLVGAVLEALPGNWKMEKTVGLVKLYGRADNDDRPESFFAEDKAEVEQRQKEYGRDAVTSLPSKPKAGKLYILDMTDIKAINRFSRDAFEFSFKPWMGAEGWKVTTPAGKAQEFFPKNYEFGTAHHGYKPLKLKNVPMYATVIPWLNKETDWLDQINKFLGLQSYEDEKREKSTPRTRENTGSCPVCFQNIKLSDSKMVLHGYLRPGWGQVHGRCYGVGYPAFELKVEGTEAYLEKMLKPGLKETEEYLRNLEADKVDFITQQHGMKVTIIKRDDPMWARAVTNAISEKKHSIKAVKEQIEGFTKLVAHWKERPLPKEGDPHIDWYFQGQNG